MNPLTRSHVVVVGAGVMGMATAAVLGERGARVTVLDPGLGAHSASAVAAGMIAPGLEAAIEGASAERAALYRVAANLWPAFSKRFQLGLVEDGADWRGPREPLAGRLAALGVEFEDGPEGLYLPGESRLEAAAALRRLHRGLRGGSGCLPLRAERIDPDADGPVVHTGGERFRADAVVLAAGAGAPEVYVEGLRLRGLISPIKGQAAVLGSQALAAVQRTVRTPDIYVSPQRGSVIVGATMEYGRSDVTVEPAAIARLLSAAVEAVPALKDMAPVGGAAGVRGATPDGLPMAGATSAPGVFAALAPRRNGWLLAPLVAEAVAAAIAGEPPAPEAGLLRPDRFDPA